MRMGKCSTLFPPRSKALILCQAQNNVTVVSISTRSEVTPMDRSAGELAGLSAQYLSAIFKIISMSHAVKQ